MFHGVGGGVRTEAISSTVITRSLIPWTQFIRQGVPSQFRVTRHPLLLNGVEVCPGEIVTPDVFLNRSRLRQMYEQRKIEPVVAPKGSVQATRDRVEKITPSAFTLGLPFDTGIVQVSDEQPITEPVKFQPKNNRKFQRSA